jgi:hypothetical protein
MSVKAVKTITSNTFISEKNKKCKWLFKLVSIHAHHEYAALFAYAAHSHQLRNRQHDTSIKYEQ